MHAPPPSDAEYVWIRVSNTNYILIDRLKSYTKGIMAIREVTGSWYVYGADDLEPIAKFPHIRHAKQFAEVTVKLCGS